MIGSAYSNDRVKAVLTKIALPPSHRIFPTQHAKTPLGTAPADSRFCAADSGFTVLYASPDFATAFVEVVVRDRFTRTERREIGLKEVTLRSTAPISSRPQTTLSLVDLRKDGCTRLGAPTDAVHARNHTAGRALGRDIHDNHRNVDGIAFSSRLTGGDVFAIFNRAVPKLLSAEPKALADCDELPSILRRHAIELIIRP